VRADEERAFEEFVAASANKLLLSAALLVGGDRAAGEDLLQGAFERCYRHWGRIADGQPEAYVRRALVNGATSRWRRLRARVPEVPLLVEREPGVPAVDHADVVSVRDGLLRALRTLPPRQRAVVVLRYLEDLPEGEVAAALGCSVGSVRSQASRGLARLRDDAGLLDAVGGPPARAARRGEPVRDVLTNERRSLPPPDSSGDPRARPSARGPSAGVRAVVRADPGAWDASSTTRGKEAL
jgi:RNA polymerase sigma-70 factor (sigma-E family)